MIEIPLKGGAANAHQTFNIQLGDTYVDFTLNYVSYTDKPAWSMDISRDGAPLVNGAMLEPGCDVIQSYGAGIGKLIFIGAEVTLDNLGTDNHLVWVSE
ncbi:MAG: Bacteriophage protein [Edwardsiella phage MSW-3]|uniref:Cyanophage baseplate Pam3 plug gp18 domain-containing protein n=2 Tax=Yokohamavirus TaxID=1980938 RepID=N0DPD1_9CAUD|nr:virion structural protein [Edwardsiella phage MSW-3]YP_008869243.1 virion structural protein [Edwardsiella phage PEi21]BAM68850.1 hypothetical protein [Edwardsiella phage MSW-3]BAN16840.1 hypothetical protein [Edwardsiella phage PEi21]BEU28756.1 MAG: Bacteriophage protein [Edwardsiella phage MSW-3]